MKPDQKDTLSIAGVFFGVFGLYLIAFFCEDPTWKGNYVYAGIYVFAAVICFLFFRK